MNTLTIGFDDNLGLPQTFTQELKLKSKPYDNAHLPEMLQDFSDEKFALMFLPTGTLTYIKSPYTIIAQATLGPNHSTTLKSNLVTAKELNLSDMATTAHGYINRYCTTSFWPLLIDAMNTDSNQPLPELIKTNGFLDLLNKIANKKIDAGWVWEVIMDKNPELTAKIQVLATQNDLPAPVIIANTNIPESLQNKITHFHSTDDHSFFNGFAKADIKLIKHFCELMAKAAQNFDLDKF